MTPELSELYGETFEICPNHYLLDVTKVINNYCRNDRNKLAKNNNGVTAYQYDVIEAYKHEVALRKIYPGFRDIPFTTQPTINLRAEDYIQNIYYQNNSTKNFGEKFFDLELDIELTGKNNGTIQIYMYR